MKKIDWDDCLCLGVKRVDDQHRHMVGLVNELIDNLYRGKGEEIVRPLLGKLREYTVYHFHDEEAFMEELRYPERHEHQQEHKRLVDQVKKYQRDIYEHRIVEPAALLSFLKDWLLDHILKMDMQIGAFVREKEAQKEMADSGQEKNATSSEKKNGNHSA